MSIDHVGQFIPDMPDFFRWIGRLAAPIFIYCLVIGFKHTSNKQKYLVRLYISGVAMSFINLYLNNVYNYIDIEMSNNFFSTLFMIGIFIYILNKKNKKLYIYFFLWQFLSAILILFLNEFDVIPGTSLLFLGSILGNMFFVEGGVFIVLLGGIFYLAKNKQSLIISYSIYCLFIFYVYRIWGGTPEFFTSQLLPFADFQWMMIAAIPIILLYNRKKGVGLKYFFYFFYPIHIIILFFIRLKLMF